MPFADGRPGKQCVLTGFLAEDGDALGRPVGVAVDQSGACWWPTMSGNVVWRVAPAEAVAGGFRPEGAVRTARACLRTGCGRAG